MREAAADAVQVSARVLEGMPDALYRLELQNESRSLVTAHVSGASGILRVLPGDQVLVELLPYDPNRGRIVKRLAR
jgi:translation initiation factor IF-1